MEPLRPDDVLPEFLPPPLVAHNRAVRGIDAMLLWVTNEVLATRWFFIASLILPLLSLLPGMDLVYRITLILSGNWIQLWALPALQRSQNTIQAKQDAKAEADHQSIAYLVQLLERIDSRL